MICRTLNRRLANSAIRMKTSSMFVATNSAIAAPTVPSDSIYGTTGSTTALALAPPNQMLCVVFL